MKKKSIINIALGAGIGALVGKVTYRLIKEHQERKFINSLQTEYEDETEILSFQEEMWKGRHYINLSAGKEIPRIERHYINLTQLEKQKEENQYTKKIK